MPITLKKDEWKVKDPSSGNYRGAAILSTTLPEDAAQIIEDTQNALDAEEVRAGQIINDAQNAVDGIEGQSSLIQQKVANAILNGNNYELIDTAVESWLDAHPEATTTVEDHSLTYNKLVNGTLGFLTPEMFGAVGDGETDDTNAFEEMFSNGEPIIIPNNEYLLTTNVFSSDKTIVYEDKGIYPQITPMYPKKKCLESLNKIGEIHKYVPNNSGSYDEAITYNSKTNKLLVGYREHASNQTSIYIIDPITWQIENVYTYPVSTLNQLTYVPTTNTILIGVYDLNLLYRINGDDMSSYQTLTMPNAETNVCYDPICHTYVGWMPNRSTGVWTATVYDDDLNLLFTKQVQLDSSTETVVQDSVAYNNKIYQITQHSIVEIDLISSEINRLGTTFGVTELEGICVAETDFYFCGHYLAGPIRTHIYKYNNNILPKPADMLHYSDLIEERDTALSMLTGEGNYHVSVSNDAESDTYGYPKRESHGILQTTEVIDPQNRYVVIGSRQKFFSINTQQEYKRYYNRTTDSWSLWNCITPEFQWFEGNTDSRWGILATDIKVTENVVLGAICRSNSNTYIRIIHSDGFYKLQFVSATTDNLLTDANVYGWLVYIRSR